MTRFRFVSQETAKLGRSDARWQANNDYRVNCEDRIIVASRDLRNSVWESCLATISTMDSKAYKKFLQGKLKEWYDLYPAVRPRLQAWAMAARTEQRRGMMKRRGEFGENSLRCNELLPPEIRSRIGPARARKNAFHIHDFIVDFIAWHPMQSLWHHMMTSKLWHHTGCNALKSNAEPMTSYDDIKTMTSYRM